MRFSKGTALLLSTFMLAGCGSSMTGFFARHGAVRHADETSDVQTYAQNLTPIQRTQISDKDEYTTTNAPHNQIYHFAFNKSSMKQEYLNSINSQAEYLIDHPNSKIRIEGHTDERGSREYNIALGMHRAKAVAQILEEDGVNPDQITVVSYGQEKPVALSHNENAYWQNRRAHLIYKSL